MKQALFAAGCFWGVQYYFNQVPGVTRTVVGYTGGRTKNPTYEEVCTHTTGHAEATRIDFDPEKVSYETLCRQFFRMHDPTQLNRQGPDVGDSYRTAIFYFDDGQKHTAGTVRDECQADFKEPIVTRIEKAGPFYEAEDYQQAPDNKYG